MAGQNPDLDVGRLRADGVGLRQRLADVAASIACTEDQVAETLERMALILPYDTARLRETAARARRYARMERDRAALFDLPS